MNAGDGLDFRLLGADHQIKPVTDGTQRRGIGWPRAVAPIASVLLAYASLTSAGTAAAQRLIHVDLVNRDRAIARKQLVRGARALVTQVNRDVRFWWPGPKIVIALDQPSARFSWVIRIERAAAQFDGSGLHGKNRRQVWARVYPSGGIPWTWATSHELLEMLEDPNGKVMQRGALREICDPVAAVGYYIDGLVVSDFVTPAWFVAGSRGPWDIDDWLKGPLRWDPASLA